MHHFQKGEEARQLMKEVTALSTRLQGINNRRETLTPVLPFPPSRAPFPYRPFEQQRSRFR